MRILSWICQGLDNPKTIRALKKLIVNHQPDIIFLMETKLFEEQFHFLNSYKHNYTTHIINYFVSGGGRAGGLALIWNHCNVHLDIKTFDLNYIDMLIYSTVNNLNCRATDIYGYPQARNKYLTCSLINDISCFNIYTNWLNLGILTLFWLMRKNMGVTPLNQI
jgi:hypothetical protein